MELLNLKDDSCVTKASKLGKLFSSSTDYFSFWNTSLEENECISPTQLMADEIQLSCAEDLNSKDLNNAAK